MQDPSPIFDHHYQNYLDRLAGLDFGRVGPAAGASVLAHNGVPALGLTYFSVSYTITGQGITDPEERSAAYDTCAILCRYLIMANDRANASVPKAEGKGDWTSFRDLKDTGPLTVYFRDNVESVICRALAGKGLATAAKKLSDLGGVVPNIGARYDLMLAFQGLPHIPMLMLFNDAEDGFPPTCSVLFRSDVEIHLDAECIAMMGHRLGVMISRRVA